MVNTKDSQMAFDYAVYMMVTSYFKKATCNTKWQEKKLLLNYREQKRDFQYAVEDIAIKFARRVLRKNVDRSIWKQEVEVSLIGHESSPQTRIRIVGKGFTLELLTEYHSRKNLKIKYTFTPQG